MAFDEALVRQVSRMRQAPEAVARDARMTQMRLVRAGNLDLIAEDAFSEAWPKPVVSNFIATAAMDMAESLAPLPTLSCVSGSMNSEAAKKRGNLRTKIGHYYWEKSKLKRHAVNAADWHFTYGFLPVIVEPCFESNLPMIRFEDPWMSYPVIDRYGSVTRYAKVFRMPARQIAAMFPELHGRLCTDHLGRDVSDTEIEVVRYMDKDCTVMYCQVEDQMGNKAPLLLAQTENYLSRCPVALAARATLDGQFRGQYDDAIWPQIARGKMASLALEAGVKAVEAPIAVPQDLVELPIGPDSIWRTESPEKIRRVSLEIPQSAFAMEQSLQEEMMRATRYPEARGGNISASVITGRGVDALMGSFDSLIKTAQESFGGALAEATSIAFEMDEKLFGDVSKEIIGISAGAPYKVTYKASDAIRGDYSAECTYGLAAGLSPNNAVVFMLQLLGAGLVSKESVQMQMPFDIDPIDMMRSITVERTRDAILEGIGALAQSIPAAAQMGQDPRMIVTQMATFLESVQKGTDIEQAALKAFAPPEAPKEQGLAGDEMLAAEATAGGAGEMGGGMPAGPEGPQALPDVMSMVSAFRGGKADMSAAVKRNTLI